MNKQLVSLFLLTACCAQPISADRIWTIGENDNQQKVLHWLRMDTKTILQMTLATKTVIS